MLSKSSIKRVAIILVIAIIGIAGIISCKANPTEVYDFSVDSSELPENNPTTNNGRPALNSSYPNSPRNWNDATYREVYVPFAGVYYDNENGARQWNRAIVSYMDSNTLTQLWKDQMDAKGRGNGKNRDFFLRNLNNNGNLKANNDYYFFDADYNIRHKKYPNVVIKEFVGGVMTMYYHDDPGSTSRGTIVVGGLYRTAIANASIVGNDKGISYFLNGRNVGDLEVLIFNVGATTGNFTYFGLDITYYNGTAPSYSGLKRNASEWYKVNRKPETLVQSLTYDALRTKYKADWSTIGSYFYFSEGDAEIER